MSAEVLRFEKQRRRSPISGRRLSAFLAIAFIFVCGAIAIGTLVLGALAAAGTPNIYPGL